MYLPLGRSRKISVRLNADRVPKSPNNFSIWHKVSSISAKKLRKKMCHERRGTVLTNITTSYSIFYQPSSAFGLTAAGLVCFLGVALAVVVPPCLVPLSSSVSSTRL